MNHLDPAERVIQCLVIRVRVERDDRDVPRQRVRDVIAEKLARADDQMQSLRILAFASRAFSRAFAEDPW